MQSFPWNSVPYFWSSCRLSREAVIQRTARRLHKSMRLFSFWFCVEYFDAVRTCTPYVRNSCRTNSPEFLYGRQVYENCTKECPLWNFANKTAIWVTISCPKVKSKVKCRAFHFLCFRNGFLCRKIPGDSMNKHRVNIVLGLCCRLWCVLYIKRNQEWIWNCVHLVFRPVQQCPYSVHHTAPTSFRWQWRCDRLSVARTKIEFKCNASQVIVLCYIDTWNLADFCTKGNDWIFVYLE